MRKHYIMFILIFIIQNDIERKIGEINFHKDFIDYIDVILAQDEKCGFTRLLLYKKEI